MALPLGFDPEKGIFTNVQPVLRIPRNPAPSSPAPRLRTQSELSLNNLTTSRPKRSLWSRFNNGVANIGNWFSDHSDDLIGWVTVAILCSIILSGIAAVVLAFINEGFWTAVIIAICAVIGGVIAYYLTAFVLLIIGNVIVYALRLLFWNAWTLLLALVVVAGACCVKYDIIPIPEFNTSAITEVVSSSKTYRCTAAVLNIRQEPNTTSGVIGVLQKGQEVEVYDTANGFARISHNGTKGYVSLKYLQAVD